MIKSNWCRLAGLLLLLVLLTGGAAYSQPAPQAKQQPNAAAPDMLAWRNNNPAIYDLQMTSSTAGWAVGQKGAIYRYAPGSNPWQLTLSPTTSTLTALDLSGTDGWAVGEKATTLRLVGGNWQPVGNPAPANTNLRSIQIVGNGEAWAVGIYNPLTSSLQLVVLHYAAGVWTQVASPVPYSDYALGYWVSPTEGWLATNETYTIYHYQNGTWTEVKLDLDIELHQITSIFMLNANEGWLGFGSGGFSNPGPVIAHYSGGIWQRLPLDPLPPIGNGSWPQYTVNDLTAFASNDYYTIIHQSDGDGTDRGVHANYLYHNGTILDSSSYFLGSLGGVVGNDLWLSGGGYGFHHWDGSSLTTVHPPVPSGDYGNTYLEMVSRSDGWITAQGNLYRLLNGSWGQVADPANGDAGPLDFLSPTEGWTVGINWSQGRSVFSRFDGNTWQPSTSFSQTNRFVALDMISPTLGWAVGSLYAGSIYGNSLPLVGQFSNGSWQAYTLPFTYSLGGPVRAHLLDVAFNAPNDGWAVGYMYPLSDKADGVGIELLVYRYDGFGWQQINIPAGYRSLIGQTVYVTSPNDVWLGGEPYAGSRDGLLHWDGSEWLGATLPFNAAINDLKMLSATEGWAVAYGQGNDLGYDKTPLLHFSGGIWRSVYNPTGYLTALDFSSPTEGWAVGPGGLIQYSDLAPGSPTPNPATPCGLTFSDVPSSHYAYSYINYLTCRGIVNGVGGGRYAPNDSASRAQLAKIVSLARGWPLQNPATASFSDVPPNHPLYRYVETARAQGAITGYDGAACTNRGVASPCYLPDDPISRAQSVLIVVRAYGWPRNTAG